MRGLVRKHQKLLDENEKLRSGVAERDTRIHKLEEQVRELNQRRQDVAKRIEDVIGRIDHLDQHFVSGARNS